MKSLDITKLKPSELLKNMDEQFLKQVNEMNEKYKETFKELSKR